MIAPVTASAATTNGANQSLVNQINALQKQLTKEHKSAIKNEVTKALTTYRSDLVKEQTARTQLEATMSAYEKAVKANEGHDKGTIVKTTPSSEKILNSVKKTIGSDQSLIQRDIQQAKNDVNKGRLQIALKDAKKADSDVAQLTRTFNAGTKGLNQITNEINKFAGTGSTTTTGAVYGTSN